MLSGSMLFVIMLIGHVQKQVKLRNKWNCSTKNFAIRTIKILFSTKASSFKLWSELFCSGKYFNWEKKPSILSLMEMIDCWIHR